MWTMTGVIPLLCAISCCYQLAALAAAVRHRRKRESRHDFQPPVSVLKPVHGLDPGFYEAIRSHATQDYPEYELLFGVSSMDDPAVPAIRRLQSEFPQLRIELIYCRHSAPNPKVAKLAGLAAHARFPVILVNDADICVQSGYLRSIVPPLADPGIGLVTCLYRTAATGLPSQFEALGIAADFAPGVLLAPWLGVKEFGLGATLLFRASDLAGIGGYAALADYAADDYQVAKRLSGLGRAVYLSKTVVETSSATTTWREAWKHQVRWQRMTRVCRPDGYAGLPVTFTALWALAALAIGSPWIAAAALAARMATALMTGLGVLGCPVVRRRWFLIPLRDLWGVAVWIGGFCGSSIRWRGDTLRLDRRGRIVGFRQACADPRTGQRE